MLLLAACEAPTAVGGGAFQATVPPTRTSAPVYTATATRTPSDTPTPSLTPSNTPTETLTPTLTLSPTETVPPSPTASLTPTAELFTLTPASALENPPPAPITDALVSVPAGWSCNDYPCADDIDGWLARINVPEGFGVSHLGRLPGQPQQITYGPDGRLYATVHLDGTQNGAVAILDENGAVSLHSTGYISPVGLAFQPGTDVLYVTARLFPTEGGVLYRIVPGQTPEAVLTNLPCCWREIDNQPNGIVFGPDGFMYMGVSALSDKAEPPEGARQEFATLDQLEATVLRIQPHTAGVEIYARGIRHPFDLAFDLRRTLYATDSGIVEGPGDRLLRLAPGAHYRWPYWRTFGCAECPPADPDITYSDGLLRFADYTLPRGLTVYDGRQFPANYFDSVFVALWNAREDGGGQRVVRITPGEVPTDPALLAAYRPQAFVTGLLRPIDVTVAPDGSLVVADFIYGNVWRVRWVG